MAKLEHLVGPSDGDDWIAFGEAAWRIEERLNVSVGHSQVTLRNLCASGEVRSVRIEYDIDPSDDPDATPVEVKMVRPSEWRITEVGLDGITEVSEGDLDHTSLPAERSLWALRDARYGRTSRRMAN